MPCDIKLNYQSVHTHYRREVGIVPCKVNREIIVICPLYSEVLFLRATSTIELNLNIVGLLFVIWNYKGERDKEITWHIVGIFLPIGVPKTEVLMFLFRIEWYARKVIHTQNS